MGNCCSKHVEVWNKYIEKSASSWSLKRITSRCTVNKIKTSSHFVENKVHYTVRKQTYPEPDESTPHSALHLLSLLPRSWPIGRLPSVFTDLNSVYVSHTTGCPIRYRTQHFFNNFNRVATIRRTADTHYRHTLQTHTTDTHYRHALQTRTTDTHYRHTLQTHTTDTLLFISHTTNVLLFKFRCNIFFSFRIIKEIPGSVASGTLCIIHVGCFMLARSRHFLNYGNH
jgi:hypothetical protein